MSTGKNNGILGPLALLAIIATVHSGPAATITGDGRDLSGFGNLKHNTSAESCLNVNNLDNIQGFADRSVTKELGNGTMGSSKALHNVRSNKRAKRYVHEGSRWRKRDLTYDISKYADSLSKRQVDDAIERAFNEWSKYIELNFTRQTTGEVDIEILFAKGDHSDEDPFDGRSGTLAHAFYPRYGGDAHFDDAELWTIDDIIGTDLYKVALHEFGHSLGLSHSVVDSSVMNRIHYSSYPKTELHIDDILGVQDLYGERINRSSRLQPTDQLCKVGKIDAIFGSNNGQIYIFKGDKYYTLSGDVLYEGFHKYISIAWPGLPDDIDAAFTYESKTYFFKGNKYWRYRGRQMDKYHPKEISEGFPGIPNHLNAAMTFSSGEEAIFYKGNSSWTYKMKYNKITAPSVLQSDTPHNMDAAIEGAPYTSYFFKDNQLYIFEKSPYRKNGMYEMSRWFGCTN